MKLTDKDLAKLGLEVYQNEKGEYSTRKAQTENSTNSDPKIRLAQAKAIREEIRAQREMRQFQIDQLSISDLLASWESNQVSTDEVIDSYHREGNQLDPITLFRMAHRDNPNSLAGCMLPVILAIAVLVLAGIGLAYNQIARPVNAILGFEITD